MYFFDDKPYLLIDKKSIPLKEIQRTPSGTSLLDRGTTGHLVKFDPFLSSTSVTQGGYRLELFVLCVSFEVKKLKL